MSKDFYFYSIKRLEKEIKELQLMVAALDKKTAIIEHNILMNKTAIEKDKRELEILKTKNISSFLFNNWTKIPQAAIILGGLLWFANWIYDLPSPSQQGNINKLVSHIESHTKKD